MVCFIYSILVGYDIINYFANTYVYLVSFSLDAFSDFYESRSEFVEFHVRD